MREGKQMRKKVAFLVLFLTLFLSACAIQSQSNGNIPTTQPVKKYIGSMNSDKYHLPSCEWARKIKPGNSVWFSSLEEARRAGYVPCKVCQPK